VGAVELAPALVGGGVRALEVGWQVVDAVAVVRVEFEPRASAEGEEVLGGGGIERREVDLPRRGDRLEDEIGSHNKIIAK
jgi:hypothetical protein